MHFRVIFYNLEDKTIDNHLIICYNKGTKNTVHKYFLILS